ncbi:replicative DNA helicase [Facklamia sp. 7083-14-GEN3]|uniref:replicative DNA helicase n=1 Tax=Facklamia sp. 7083-14-GEN3 TaxID=2973478 RepID=UPI00215BFBF4|nr:replicative DNA helicase [Facklamia sp. 7083-14-GEN3]MCR8969857.1 replicative DNA helicase [Facklamia sp. 7083-14-GEN3]
MEFTQMNQMQAPQNIEAERSVLGGLLLEPKKLATVQTLLQEQDFYKVAHQQIFAAMERVFDRDNTLDHLMLKNQLDALDQLENIGGYEYIVELTGFTPTTANIENYARIVKEKSILRQLIQASSKISQVAYDEENAVEEIIDQSEKLILSIGEGSQSNRPQMMRQLIAEAFDNIVKLAEEKRDVVGLPTGYHELDKLTSGFQPDQLVIIAARPSVGKTAFALNIAQNVATKSKVPVVIFSLEMGALDMVYRMICAEGSIHASNLRTGQLTDDEWKSFTVATDILREAPIYIDDSAGIRVSEIRAKCRRLKQENPDLGLIVIDYLQLIDGNGRENRQQEVSEISRQLKKLSKELSVPVIALSQLSRGLEQRQNKRPILSDIRESGSIEQDADIVAFLYREDYHQQDGDEDEGHKDDLPDNTVEVIIAKNRAGARDTVKLLFKKEYNKFSSLSYQKEPFTV